MSDSLNGSSNGANGSTGSIELVADPTDLSPGQLSTVSVRLVSHLEHACSFAVSVAGLEADWVSLPASVGPVDPGASIEVPIGVSLPNGYPASTLVGTVTVTSLDGEVDRASASTDLQLVIGDGTRILASLEPAETRGWHIGRIALTLRNRGASPVQVDLLRVAPDNKVTIHFEDPAPVLSPGREVRVAARVRSPFFFTGAPRRRPYAVRVQGRSTPIVLEGSFLQRPVVSQKVMKLTALAGVAALWIAAAAIGISTLSAHLQRSATSKAVASAPPVTSPSSPQGGPGAASGSGNSAGGGSGANNGGGAGSSSSSGGAGGPSASSSAAANAAAAQGLSSGVRVGGKVNSSAPAGVTVTVAPTSLTDPGTAGATPIGTDAVLDSYQYSTTSKNLSAGKVYGTDVGAPFDAGLTAAVDSPTMSTTTTADGTWAVAGLHYPGTYLVTFSKPGFSTQKYLLTTSKSGQTMQLDATVTPGSGSISGTISGPKGKLGGVTVSVSDGTVTLSTRTPTVGADVGQWSLKGLTTPDTYVVTATKDGYSTETTQVQLGASGTVSNASLKMKSGLASITGTVVSDTGAVGIGGVSVTATNGTTTEKATTTTTGTVGSYNLPNLPIPGTYALTVSGAGWVTQTRSVQLTTNAVVGASLTPTSAQVSGFAYTSDGAGLGAAGVTLSDGTNTYKTLTQSTNPVGSFDFSPVPPGNYVLTVSEYGYASSSAQITVTAGQMATTSLILQSVPASSQNTATIQGTVEDLFNQTGLSGVSIVLDGSVVATSSANGTYQVNNVAPGVHTLTGQPAAGQGFESASINVNVPLGGVVTAPQIELPKLDTLTGTVSSGAATGGIDGASIVLVPSTGTLPSGNTGSSTTSSSTTTTSSTTSTTSTTIAGATGNSGTGPVTSASTTTGSGGTYSLANLLHGNYQLQISAPGYQSTTLDITLAADESLREDITLTLLPAFNVVAYAPTTGGGTAQADGVCVTVTGPDSFSETLLSSATSAVNFTPLTAGQSYTASFWEPSGTHTGGTIAGVPPAPCPQDEAEIGTAPSTTFTAQNNNAAIYTAIMAPQLPAVAISLSYEYEIAGTGSTGTTVDCPVVTEAGGPEPTPYGSTNHYGSCPILNTLPIVSITGITGYTTNTSGGLGTPITSSPIDAAAPSGTSNVWNFAPSTLNAIISEQVSVKVDGTSTPFETTTPTETLSGAGPVQIAIVLTPTPVQITGTIPVSSATITVSPDLIPVNPDQNALTQASITASDSSGNLVWGDTQVGSAGYAQPGVYSLSASATGYEQSGSVPVNVGVVSGVLTGAATNVAIGLNQQTTLKVTENGWTQFANQSPPTIYLLYDNEPPSASNGGAVSVTDGLSGTTTSTNSLQLQGQTDSATFTYLSPSKQTSPPAGETGYSLVVIAPGYQTYFYSFTSLTPSMTINATQVEESVISGTVDGSIDSSAASALAGVTVTATLTSTPVGGCPGAPSGAPSNYTNTFPSTLTGTTASDGTFALTGSATLGLGSNAANDNAGLCPGASYSISTTLNGYNTGTSSASSLSTGPNAISTITMNATPIIQNIEVSPSTGTFLSTALPTISVSSTLGEDFTCQDVTVEPLGAPPDCNAPTVSGSNFSITVYPTAYEYTIVAPDYQPLYLSAISYTPGETLSTVMSVTLQPQENTITGTVTAGSTAVVGLTIDLYSTGTSTLAGTATSTSSGYTISGIAGGTYYAEPAVSTGYSDTNTPTYFSTNYPFTAFNNLTVEGTPTTVNVTVTASGSTTYLSGATVSLTKTSSSVGLSCQSGAASEGLLVSGLGTNETGTLSSSGGSTYSASIPSVTPDFYLLNVSGTNIPSQTAASIEICPTTTTTSESFEVMLSAPGAPTIGTPIAATGQATVNWTDPSSDGGSPITSYTATASPGGLTCTANTASATSCVVMGLTNGTPYTFTVIATNAIGPSASSGTSSSVTPATVPDQTTGVSASLQLPASAVITWSQPGDDGGATITGYTATSSPGSQTCTSTGALTCTVSGLTPGQSYTFTVTATNSVGTGLASTASGSVAIPTVPDAPTAITATATTSTSAVTTWTAPSDGGNAITSYTVTATPGGVTCTITGTPPVTQCTFSDDLTPSTGYTFTVTATNGVGTSNPSTASGLVTTPS